MKTIDTSDPFEIARICPAGLISVALSEIPMPVRCQNVLVKQELSTVGQLQGLYLKDALHWANFGKKSATDLAEALRRFIDSRARSGDVFVSAPGADSGAETETEADLFVGTTSATTLQQELDEFVALLKPSQKRVLEERVLNQKSLEHVGELLGVTRERIRQIESRLLDTLGKLPWMQSLRERLSTLLSRRSDPLFLDLVEVEDACVQVLIESGHALHSREIKERIGRLRGTSEFFFIQPTERMARVAPNKWGFVERDFGLTIHERATFLADLESELEKRAISLHVSELSKLIETRHGEGRGPTDYMLMGLVQTNPRFRVHRGHLIALATWSDARRPTLRSAVGQCIGDGRRTEVSVTELVVELAALVGREVQRGEVTNALLQLGWRRQGSTETYVAGFGDEEEAVEESLDALVGESSYTAA
jgi:RNA polymerase sigma factor (sigma-70 family)